MLLAVLGCVLAGFALAPPAHAQTTTTDQTTTTVPDTTTTAPPAPTPAVSITDNQTGGYVLLVIGLVAGVVVGSYLIGRRGD